jgi:hypothetical protein
MNIGVTTIAAVPFVAVFARAESIFIFNAVETPDFIGIAIIVTSRDNTVEASLHFTLRALFGINAVHAIRVLTALAVIHCLTVSTVTPLASITHTNITSK